MELQGCGISVTDLKGVCLEGDDSLQKNLVRSHAGAGGIDGVECVLEYPPSALPEIANLNPIWRILSP
ncbi:MAG: hypothetical protein ACYC6Y_02485 [Thermoguttaceae bacterium]